MPRRVSAPILACCTLALAAGCGSSGPATGSTGAGGAGAGASGGGAAAGAVSTAGATSGAVGSGGAAGAARSGGTSLKVDTTPKFAKPSGSEPVRSGVVQIAYRNIAIDPDTVRVKVGTRIRWTNYDSTQANVTSEGGPQRFASKNFGEGGTFEITAERPGLIHYECTLYPVTMNGTIEVVS